MGEKEKQHALEMVNKLEKEIAALPLDATTLFLHKRLIKDRDYWLTILKQEDADGLR